MKKLLLPLIFLSGCWGYSSTDSEAIGQIKKVIHETPLICDAFTTVDISMGVMRNGVGSMSSEDKEFYVEDKQIEQQLRQLADSGKLARVTYSIKRWRWCVEVAMITKVEELN